VRYASGVWIGMPPRYVQADMTAGSRRVDSRDLRRIVTLRSVGAAGYKETGSRVRPVERMGWMELEGRMSPSSSMIRPQLCWSARLAQGHWVGRILLAIVANPFARQLWDAADPCQI
jgi:hypothetical protein